MSSATIDAARLATFRSECELAPLVKKDKMYTCGDLMIQLHPNDSVLAYIYQRFHVEGLVGRIWSEGPPPTLLQFLVDHLQPEKNAVAVFKENSFTMRWDAIGLGWVNQITKMQGGAFLRANVGEAFFRKTNPRDAVLAAQMILELGFDLLKIDTMIGVTPVKNRVACLFPKKLGFQIAGRLEGATVWGKDPCDAQLASMTKARWALARPCWG